MQESDHQNPQKSGQAETREQPSMASAVLTNIKEEVTCPICLELMREPVSIDCGHSFCQTCITSNNVSTMGPGEERNCPVCRIPYNFENLRPNLHIANIIESLKGVKLSSPEQNVHHCAQHDEKLQLFCRDDGKVICWLCERSQQHQGHHTCLLEEVAQEYQNKLQTALKKLQKSKEESEKWKAKVQQEKTSWKTQRQGKIQNVQADFTQLRGILDSEEEKVLQKLQEEEAAGWQDLVVCENELTQQSKWVTQLISDVELRLKGSTVEMLQDVNTIMKRCKRLTMEKPITFPKKEQKVFPITGLRGMLQVFQELTDARRYWVYMTLTTPINSRIDISPDQRQISYQRNSFDSKNVMVSRNLHRKTFHDSGFSISQFPENNLPLLGVLGAPVITSGKHYWEVDVSRKTSWHLGVSDGRHFRPRPRPDPTVHEVPCPKIGYWIIGMEKKSEYKVFWEDPTSHFPLPMPLCLPVALDRVGVFVDYQAGSVSFYSTTYNAFLIYKFTNCSFPRQVYPYFNPLQCSEPMTLCLSGS